MLCNALCLSVFSGLDMVYIQFRCNLDFIGLTMVKFKRFILDNLLYTGLIQIRPGGTRNVKYSFSCWDLA